MRFDNMRFSHVPDTEHQAQLAIAQANDSVPGVQQGLGSLFRSRHLSEHDSHL